MKRLYRFLYVTTNLINGKQYFGQHTTYNLDDGYLGSGTLLKKAIEKYGKENFVRQIIQFVDTAEELNRLEKNCIETFDAIKDAHYYNLADGGHPGCPPRYGKDNPMFGRKGELSPRFGSIASDKTREKIRKAALERFKDKTNHPSFGKTVSEETRKKQSEAKKGKYLGKDNPNYGKRWSDEQRERASKNRKGKNAGGLNPRAKAVLCLDANIEYGSATEGAKAYHCDRHWVIECCNGKRETAGGVHWAYANTMHANTVPSTSEDVKV